jgi:hypothetical protein
MYFVLHRLMLFICVHLIFCFVAILRCSLQKFKVIADLIIKWNKSWRPSHVCFICGTLPTGTLIVCIPNLFFFSAKRKTQRRAPPIRWRSRPHLLPFAQVQIFGGKSNVFKSLQYNRYLTPTYWCCIFLLALLIKWKNP